MTEDSEPNLGRELVSHRRQLEKVCEVCDRPFVGRVEQRFCSDACRAKAYRERQRRAEVEGAVRRTRSKYGPGDRVRANEHASGLHHPKDSVGREGTIVTYGPGRAEYTVLFDGETEPTYFNTAWLEPA